MDAADQVWIVYMLRCRGGSLYTGITTDLKRRLTQHNAGRGARYTRSRRPVIVVFQETQLTKSLALKREAALKGLTRPQKEGLIRNQAGTN